MVLLLGSCLLESESPILAEESLESGAGQAPDISGEYFLQNRKKSGSGGDDSFSLRRKEGSANAFIPVPKKDENSSPSPILVAALEKPGTLLLQTMDPDSGKAALIPARITEKGLTFFPQTDTRIIPRSRTSLDRSIIPSTEIVFLWDKDAWIRIAKRHGLTLSDDSRLLRAGADKENVLAAMNDMFAAGAFGQGQTYLRAGGAGNTP